MAENDIKTEIKILEEEALKEISGSQDLKELADVSRKYLGKKGVVKILIKELKNLAKESRRERGALINQLQEAVGLATEARKRELTAIHFQKELKSQAEELGFDIPKIGHLHPITQTIKMMNQIFTEMGYSIMDGPEIETDEYCFRRLNVPLNHPARDMQDTIYIKEPGYLLRTHASSIEARLLANYKPPLKVVCPGRVYRNEKVNKSNHFIFHHYQGVVVLKTVGLKDLFGTLDHLLKKLYGPKIIVRYRNKYYPEVEPGVGQDIQCFNCRGRGCSLCKNVGWLEMAGAGIIHPNILKMAGINSNQWMGFAFGLGLDRLVMAKYKISDIRTLLGGSLGYKYYENENTLQLP